MHLCTCADFNTACAHKNSLGKQGQYPHDVTHLVVERLVIDVLADGK